MLFISQILGVIGVVMVMIAYFLLERGDLDPHSLPFPLINLIGSCLIVLSLVYVWNWPSFFMESSWAMISLYGMCKIYLKKHQS